MNENSIRGIEQGRAAFAYDCVNEIAQNSNEDLKKKYKSGAKKTACAHQNQWAWAGLGIHQQSR